MMHLDPSKLVIGLLIAGLVAFRIYSRVRKSIGRQRLQPASLVIRALVLAGVCGLFVLSPLMTGADVAWSAAGALIGLGLAAYALMHTTVEATAEGRFYTGHPVIGLLVTGLLIARIGFRMIQSYAAISTGAAPPPHADPLATTFASPTTLAVFFLMAGYYVLYGAGVLVKARDVTSA